LPSPIDIDGSGSTIALRKNRPFDRSAVAHDNTDRAHTACVDLFETTSDTLISTALVVAETGYMIERQLGPVADGHSVEHARIRGAAGRRRNGWSGSGAAAASVSHTNDGIGTDQLLAFVLGGPKWICASLSSSVSAT